MAKENLNASKVFFIIHSNEIKGKREAARKPFLNELES